MLSRVNRYGFGWGQEVKAPWWAPLKWLGSKWPNV